MQAVVAPANWILAKQNEFCGFSGHSKYRSPLGAILLWNSIRIVIFVVTSYR